MTADARAFTDDAKDNVGDERLVVGGGGRH